MKFLNSFIAIYHIWRLCIVISPLQWIDWFENIVYDCLMILTHTERNFTLYHIKLNSLLEKMANRNLRYCFILCIGSLDGVWSTVESNSWNFINKITSLTFFDPLFWKPVVFLNFYVGHQAESNPWNPILDARLNNLSYNDRWKIPNSE